MSRIYRILLIEDDAGDAELMQEILSDITDIKFEIELAESLVFAKDRLDKAEEPFDIVLLDLGMRDTIGMETFDAFKKFKAGLPVIITTGLDDEEIAIQAITEGAQDYLVKGRFDSLTAARAVRYAVERYGIEKKLAETVLQYRSIFETVSDAILIHDFEGRMIEINPAAENLYGYTTQELLQKKIDELVVPEQKGEIASSFYGIEKGAVMRWETADLTRKGDKIHTIKTSRRFIYKGEKQILTVVHDITELKKAEQELRQHRDTLEQKVQERTAELQKKYDELERIYKLMIGREFRIKELRDEVKELKAKIKN
jgi:PAS domain S-box-containing protein